MNRIMDPGRLGTVAAEAPAATAMKSQQIEEQSVQEQRMGQPVEAPSPTARTKQAGKPGDVRRDIDDVPEPKSGIAG